MKTHRKTPLKSIKCTHTYRHSDTQRRRRRQNRSPKAERMIIQEIVKLSWRTEHKTGN